MTKPINIAVSMGLTIVELLVSLAIGAMIMAGVIQLYVTSAQNSITFEGATRIQENARFAFDLMTHDISMAGSGVCLRMGLRESYSLLLAETGANQKYDFSGYVSGKQGTGPNGTDELIVRYVNQAGRIPVRSFDRTVPHLKLDASSPNYAKLKQFDVVFAADCKNFQAFMITNEPTGDGVIEFKPGITSPTGQANSVIPAEEFGLKDTFGMTDSNTTSLEKASAVYVFAGESSIEYKIGDSVSGSCSETTPQHCALLRNDVEIVSGVEDFKVEYIWEDAAGNMFYGDWNSVVAQGASEDIRQIKIDATFNSIDPAATVSGEEFLSKSFSRVFFIRSELEDPLELN